jgi:hypothetical protein
MELEMIPSDRSEIPDWSPCIMSTPLKENASNDSIVVWTPKCTDDSPQSLDVTVSSVLSQWSAHDCRDPKSLSDSVIEWTPGAGSDKEPSVADSVVSWNQSWNEQHIITPVKASTPMTTPSTTNLVAMKPKQISFSKVDVQSQSSSEGEFQY